MDKHILNHSGERVVTAEPEEISGKDRCDVIRGYED